MGGRPGSPFRAGRHHAAVHLMRYVSACGVDLVVAFGAAAWREVASEAAPADLEGCRSLGAAVGDASGFESPR